MSYDFNYKLLINKKFFLKKIKKDLTGVIFKCIIIHIETRRNNASLAQLDRATAF